MKQNQQLIKQLRVHHFWDVDVSRLDDVANMRLIIERIFNYGSVSEIEAVIEHYGLQTVIETVCRLSWLDPKTLNFVSKLFNLPKTAFRCYNRNQSKLQHWSL